MILIIVDLLSHLSHLLLIPIILLPSINVHRLVWRYLGFSQPHVVSFSQLGIVLHESLSFHQLLIKRSDIRHALSHLIRGTCLFYLRKGKLIHSDIFEILIDHKINRFGLLISWVHRISFPFLLLFDSMDIFVIQRVTELPFYLYKDISLWP